MAETRFDVAVVGAGPAGIAAACRAAESGSSVALIDENPWQGGQIWRQPAQAPSANGPPPLARRWLNRLHDTECRIFGDTAIVDATREGALIGESRGAPQVFLADRIVIATGARELFLPFPGWTLPNVMGVGAAQALVKSGMDFRDRKIVLAGSGPVILPVAAALQRSGAHLKVVAEQASIGQLARLAMSLWHQPGKLVEGLKYRSSWLGTRYRTGHWAVGAEGDEKVERVVLSDGRRTWTEACDYLLCSYGFVPNLELAQLLGCHLRDGFVAVDRHQRTSVPHVYCAGEPTGIGGDGVALVEGEIAGLQASGHEAPDALTRRAKSLQRIVPLLADTFRPRKELLERMQADTIVCRCEDVPWKEIEPFATSREAKIQSRASMGPCQGRICGPALALLRGWEVPDSIRPPIKPCSVATMSRSHDEPSAP